MWYTCDTEVLAGKKEASNKSVNDRRVYGIIASSWQ